MRSRPATWCPGDGFGQYGKFYNSFEAGAAQSRLEADGIESFLFDINMSWEGMGIIPIRLMVDEDDLAQAKRLLAQSKSGPT